MSIIVAGCNKCGKTFRVSVHFPELNKGFEETLAVCAHCGARLLIADKHKYTREGTIIGNLKQYVREYMTDYNDNIIGVPSDAFVDSVCEIVENVWCRELSIDALLDDILA